MSTLTYYESGVPRHLRLVYGDFHFGTGELLLIVTGKMTLGQLPGRNEE